MLLAQFLSVAWPTTIIPKRHSPFAARFRPAAACQTIAEIWYNWADPAKMGENVIDPHQTQRRGRQISLIPYSVGSERLFLLRSNVQENLTGMK